MLKSGSVVSILAWSRDGEILHYDKVIVTSHRWHPDTVNVMFQNSRDVRQIRTKLIFMINDMEVCL